MTKTAATAARTGAAATTAASAYALIVAAGRGSRARRANDNAPKQYAMIGNRPVLSHTIGQFLSHSDIAFVQVVIHADDLGCYERAIAKLQDHLERAAFSRLLPPVVGGASRQASVRLGLEALRPRNPKLVLVHDAARPFIDHAVISRVVAALAHHQGAIAATPLSDTLKRANADGTIAATLERAHLWRAQTPQGFHYQALDKAHQAALQAGETAFTDDAAVAEWAKLDVVITPGHDANTKITTLEDLQMADQKIIAAGVEQGSADARGHLYDLRIGNGFDVHRFAPGDHVWLCGIKIAHDQSLSGHSDADVALHALTDALLGAIADGDIGAHFPPSDPKWKGASSDQFLAHAGDLIAARGGRINNVDVTILCEHPKIGPHRDAMRQSIANILQLGLSRVAVKATTTERLGFTGRGEGIAAMASAAIALPGDQ